MGSGEFILSEKHDLIKKIKIDIYKKKLDILRNIFHV